MDKDTASIHKGNLLPYDLHGYIDYGQNQKYFLYFMSGLGLVGALFVIGGLCAMIATFRTPKEEPQNVAIELGQFSTRSQ